MSKKTIAIIVAAGISSRTEVDKLFAEILPGTSVLQHTIDIFMQHDAIDEVVVVAGEERIPLIESLLASYTKPYQVVSGGNSRFESVFSGISTIAKNAPETRVVVHNAANTYLDGNELTQALALPNEHIVCAFPATSTFKVVTQDNVIKNHLKKDTLFEAQTPQISTLNALQVAYKKAYQDGIEFDDEAELLAYAGYEIQIFPCSFSNKKITFWKDLPGKYVFGYGEDSHKFLKNFDNKKPLILGGFRLAESLSIDADSDGDVILHAVTNALLSMVGKKPIGSIADEMAQNGIVDSKKYLEKALDTIRDAYTLQHVIIHLEASRPKLNPYHEKIITSLSRILHIDKSSIALTYETGDALSPFAQGMGLRAYCTILSKKITSVS